MRVGGTTEYEYDACGRIVSIKENNKLSTYQYDKIGQLIRKNNKHLDKTFIYNYNEVGNITSVRSGFLNMKRIYLFGRIVRISFLISFIFLNYAFIDMYIQSDLVLKICYC